MRNGMGVMLRRLMRGTVAPARSSCSISSENLIFASSAAAAAASYSTLILADDAPFLVSAIAPAPAANFQPLLLNNHYRSFSSSAPSSDSSNVVSIESEEQFKESLRKVQEKSLPALFYFTAVWCGPCRLVSPIISQLSEKYPNVTTYKVDIDKEELGNALSELDIQAVPTMHFFHDGKMAKKVVGADVQALKDTMEALYK